MADLLSALQGTATKKPMPATGGAEPNPLYTPAPTPPATPQAAAPPSADPFAAMGGGVLVNGGWVPKNHPLAQQAGQTEGPITAPPLTQAPATSVPEAKPTAAIGATSTTPAQNPQQPATTIQGAYQNALLKQLNTNPVVNSVQEDPALAAQSGAFRQAAARSEQRQRNAAAERAAATGTLESGGFDATVQQIGNDRAFAESQNDAQLLGGARQQRMNELYQALALGGNQLNEDEKNQIQLQLMELEKQQNAATNALAGRELDIRQSGIDSQTRLGQGDLDLRGYLGKGQLGLGLLSTLLNDRQVNTGQGIQLGLGQAGLNQQALLGLLGGLS